MELEPTKDMQISELRQKVDDFTWALNRVTELLVEEGGTEGANLVARVLSQVQSERLAMLARRTVAANGVDIAPQGG